MYKIKNPPIQSSLCFFLHLSFDIFLSNQEESSEHSGCAYIQNLLESRENQSKCITYYNHVISRCVVSEKLLKINRSNMWITHDHTGIGCRPRVALSAFIEILNHLSIGLKGVENKAHITEEVLQCLSRITEWNQVTVVALN